MSLKDPHQSDASMPNCSLGHEKVKNMISCNTKSNLYEKKTETEIEIETESPDIS